MGINKTRQQVVASMCLCFPNGGDAAILNHNLSRKRAPAQNINNVASYRKTATSHNSPFNCFVSKAAQTAAHTSNAFYSQQEARKVTKTLRAFLCLFVAVSSCR